MRPEVTGCRIAELVGMHLRGETKVMGKRSNGTEFRCDRCHQEGRTYVTGNKMRVRLAGSDVQEPSACLYENLAAGINIAVDSQTVFTTPEANPEA